MSSCSTPWCAEYVSWQIAARMPAILHAATDAPTPEPQTSTPRSALPALDRLAELARLVRIVDPDRVGVGAEVDDLVPDERLEHRVAQVHAAMVESDGELHRTSTRAICPRRT